LLVCWLSVRWRGGNCEADKLHLIKRIGIRWDHPFPFSGFFPLSFEFALLPRLHRFPQKGTKDYVRLSCAPRESDYMIDVKIQPNCVLGYSHHKDTSKSISSSTPRIAIQLDVTFDLGLAYAVKGQRDVWTRVVWRSVTVCRGRFCRSEDVSELLSRNGKKSLPQVPHFSSKHWPEIPRRRINSSRHTSKLSCVARPDRQQTRSIVPE